jgi:hypothetical protein
MQDVSKIVIERLRAAVQVANHPEADVLTAFSEHSLPEGERAVVLEHLALCGDCREILALAQPAAEATQIIVRPAPSGWLSWPALRWGFVALGIFAIASLGVVEYRRHSPSASSMAYFATARQSMSDEDKAKIPAAATSADAVSPKAQVAAPSPVSDLGSYGGPPASGASARKAVTPASGRVTRKLSQPPRAPKVPSQNAQSQNAYSFQTDNHTAPGGVQGAAAPAYAPQPADAWVDAGSAASAQTVAAQSQKNAQPGIQGQNRQPLLLESENVQPAEPGQGNTVERAKEPGVVVATGQAQVPVSSPQPPDALAGSSSQPSASWTIANGSLERSVDQGKSWQNVEVNAVPAQAANSTSAVQPARLKQEAVPPVFRAVAANGPDVWAGGLAALLCHSVDSGTHWIRILPSAGGAILTGDIVGVDFPDTRHGRITTSTPEVWRTSDGGQTWQKQ